MQSYDFNYVHVFLAGEITQVSDYATKDERKLDINVCDIGEKEFVL